MGVATASTWAQDVSRRAAAGVPGVWYRGHFFGYAPHGRQGDRSHRFAGPGILARDQVADRGDRNTDQPDRGTEPAAYDRDEVGDETAEGIDVDSVGAWDPDTNRDGTTDDIFQECALTGPDESWLWGRAEYLLWWTRGMSTPPLATTSLDGTVQGQAGVLGLPGTSILSGATRVLGGSRSGGRFTLGAWLDDYHDRGVEATYLLLEDDSTTFVGSGSDRSILARPFFNIQNGTPDARLIVFPNLVDGVLTTETATELQTFDFLYRRVIRRWRGSRLDLVLGYRYADLDDLLQVTESTQSLSGPTVGSTIDLFDRFDTENTFNGGTIGIKFLRKVYRCWSIEAVANVALGSTRSKASVTGQTISTTAQGGSATTPNGLLTQQTNIGSYSRAKFSTVSEFGVSLRRSFTRRLSARVGYTFLYWTSVARAGEQVDLDINPSQIPPGTLQGAPRPAFPFATTNFWAQGLNFGLEYKY